MRAEPLRKSSTACLIATSPVAARVSVICIAKENVRRVSVGMQHLEGLMALSIHGRFPKKQRADFEGQNIRRTIQKSSVAIGLSCKNKALVM